MPVEDVDRVVVLKPEQGQGCQAPFVGEDAFPFRHQVSALPPSKPVITEYPWHQLGGAACGAPTRAPWPPGVPSGTYQEQRVAHLAETSWRPSPQRAWLGGAVTSLVTVCMVRLARGGQVARDLVGETCAGILVTDR